MTPHTSKTRILTQALLLITLCTAPGCFKRKIYISSNAYADRHALPHGFAPGSSFAIAHSQNEENPQPELLTKELSQKATILLKERGFRIKKMSAADFCLLLDFGSTCETKTAHVLKFIPGQTLGSTGTSVDCHGHCHFYHNVTETPGSFAFVPENYIDCTKFLSCTVYSASEFAQSKEKLPAQLWHAESWTTDQNTNLRDYLDYLLIQNIDLLGVNTQTTCQTKWYEGDERVENLRKNYEG